MAGLRRDRGAAGGGEYGTHDRAECRDRDLHIAGTSDVEHTADDPWTVDDRDGRIELDLRRTNDVDGTNCPGEDVERRTDDIDRAPALQSLGAVRRG